MSLSTVVRPLCFSAILAIGVAESESAEPLRYNCDIRPILADKCFTCHGLTKKAGIDLRLDQRDVAVKLGAIVPGKPDESELLSRVSSADADVMMPPPASKLGHLAKDEIAKFRQWIAEGAEYQPHWSFIPLHPVALPNQGKPSPIDAIVRDSLARRGLKPQPEADRATLIRRVTFDLTGLPLARGGGRVYRRPGSRRL